ncbi:MAG TPA: cellulase family glycosylhydrolase [bacterium]|nr:cellulase family glycosylhydrolase [bacterium]
MGKWKRAGWVLLAAWLLAAGPGCDFKGSGGRSVSGTAYPLSTRGQWIIDAQGRTVIWRGVNYNGIESMLFDDQPPALEDFQLIRRWGFNVVRLTVSWEFIEPDRDAYDEDHLATWVDPAIAFAAQEGIGVILNMHQWNWSTCFDPGGRGNGAPPWALPEWARDDCPIDGPDAYTQMTRASADFWLDMDAREEYMEMWEMMAARYQDNPAVIAYDVFNEPQPGDIWGGRPVEFDQDILQPFHEELIRRIRAVDPMTIIVYECSIMHDVYDNDFTAMPFNNIVYSTHNYTGGTAGGHSGTYIGPEPLRADIERGVMEAARQGVPLYIGEFAVGGSQPIAEDWMRAEFRFQEQYLVSGTWWGLRQHDNTAQGLMEYDTKLEKPALLDYVSRPYPAATAGLLMSYSFDEPTKSFNMTFMNSPAAAGPTLIAIPEYQYPDGVGVECSDTDGTWSYSHDPVAGYVSLTVNPAQPIHSVFIYPAD